jgi:single-strand DNA-binding protein
MGLCADPIRLQRAFGPHGVTRERRERSIINQEKTALNKIIITGHLGRDPEARNTQAGKLMATVSVAVRGASKKDPADWFRVVFFDRLAEIATTYLKKGAHVAIEGRLSVTRFKAADGTEKTSVEIVARDLEMLSARQQSESAPEGSASAATPAPKPVAPDTFTPLEDDDILFYYQGT